MLKRAKRNHPKSSNTLLLCFYALLCVMMFGGGINPVQAAPFPEQSFIWIRQLEDGWVWPPPENPVFFNSTTTSNSFSNTHTTAVGSGVQARGDLATGETGTSFKKYNVITMVGSSSVCLFDTLTFTTDSFKNPVEVTFKLNFEGTQANSTSGTYLAGAFSHTSVRIYDITPLSTWIETGNYSGVDAEGNPYDDIYYHSSSAADLVASLSVIFALGSQEFLDAGYQSVSDQYLMDTSGTPRNFSLSKSNSFWADPTKVYGIELCQSSQSAGIAKSDFYSTGTFSFTNLNGASFVSDSGVFLSQSGSEPVPVAIDIKPKSCPNALNVKNKGVLPVAILGTVDFNVSSIDITTLKLEGISPVRNSIKDVTTPSELEPCDCESLDPDSFEDLVLKFDKQAIVETFGEDVQNGDEIELTLTGDLLDGTAIVGIDCVVIKGVK